MSLFDVCALHLSVKPGWGEWAGIGLSGVSQKTLASRERQIKKIDEESAEKRALRKDGKIFNVVLSDRRIKSAAKYKIGEVPHPFTTREEYERSIQMPLGGKLKIFFCDFCDFVLLFVLLITEEWNASHIVRKNTKPEVMTRAGRIIAPIKLPKGANGPTNRDSRKAF